MLLRIRIVSLIIISGLLFTCTSKSPQKDRIFAQIESDAKPWTSLAVNNSSDRFRFAIIADNTGGERPGILADAVFKLNLLQPQFVINVGDLIQGKTEDVQEIERQWKHIDAIFINLKMPLFVIPGNHDYSNQVMADFWRKRYGTPYYYFIYKKVLFLCLNSEDDVQNPPATAILNEQYAYAEKVLEMNPDMRWTFVFLHKPLWLLENTGKWNDLEKLLAKRRHTVFAGHMHHYAKYERNNGEYFVLSTTGGAKIRRGVDFGEFDHLVWVTMSDEGPIFANIILDGLWNEDMLKKSSNQDRE